MNLRTFVSRVSKYMPGVSVTDILGYIDTVHKLMYHRQTDKNIWRLPSGTDQFPYVRLSDVSDINPYIEVEPANVLTNDGDAVASFTYCGITVTARKIAYVFCEREYLDSYTDDVVSAVLPDLGRSQYDWVKYPIQTIDAKNSAGAKVKLLSEPNDGAKLFVSFYIGLPDLTTIDDNTLFDWGVDYKLITDGVVGMYEDIVNGNSIRYERFMQMLPIWESGENELGNNTYSRNFPARDIG